MAENKNFSNDARARHVSRGVASLSLNVCKSEAIMILSSIMASRPWVTQSNQASHHRRWPWRRMRPRLLRHQRGLVGAALYLYSMSAGASKRGKASAAFAPIGACRAAQRNELAPLLRVDFACKIMLHIIFIFSSKYVFYHRAVSSSSFSPCDNMLSCI